MGGDGACGLRCTVDCVVGEGATSAGLAEYWSCGLHGR